MLLIKAKVTIENRTAVRQCRSIERLNREFRTRRNKEYYSKKKKRRFALYSALHHTLNKNLRWIQ